MPRIALVNGPTPRGGDRQRARPRRFLPRLHSRR